MALVPAPRHSDLGSHWCLIVGAASLIISTFGTAQAAEPVAGLYTSGGFGVDWLADISPTGANYGKTVGFSDGPAAGISQGWGWGNALRTELEIGLDTNKAKTLGGAPLSGGIGDSYFALANALYDFTEVDSAIIPHLGLGAGLATTRTGGFSTSLADRHYFHADPFTYQLIAGIDYAVPNTTLVKLGIDFRYVGTDTIHVINARTTGTSYTLGYSTVLFSVQWDWSPLF